MPKTSGFKIKFVGKKSGKQPLESFTDGSRTITLPKDQSKPFAHPDARAILQHAPHLYKKVLRTRKIYRSSVSGEFVSPTMATENPQTTVSETVALDLE